MAPNDLPLPEIFDMLVEKAAARGLLKAITPTEIEEFKAFFLLSPSLCGLFSRPFLSYVTGEEMNDEENVDENGFYVNAVYVRKAGRPMFGVFVPFAPSGKPRELLNKKEWLDVHKKVWRYFLYPEK